MKIYSGNVKRVGKVSNTCTQSFFLSHHLRVHLGLDIFEDLLPLSDNCGLLHVVYFLLVTGPPVHDGRRRTVELALKVQHPTHRHGHACSKAQVIHHVADVESLEHQRMRMIAFRCSHEEGGPEVREDASKTKEMAIG